MISSLQRIYTNEGKAIDFELHEGEGDIFYLRIPVKLFLRSPWLSGNEEILTWLEEVLDLEANAKEIRYP